MILNMIIYLALGIAFLVPLLFLYIIRRSDSYRTGKFHINIVTLLGGIVAYSLAANINPAILNEGWGTREQVIRFIAPIVEELLKSLILIYLVRRADFNYVVDGAIYGFGAGIGFAIIENYEYVLGHSEIALTVAIARVLSTNLVHATGSGMIGAALAFRRGDNTWFGWLIALLGYVFSIVFHMGFNTMVNVGTILVFAVTFGFVGVGLIWFAIKRGLNVQKAWVGEKLGMKDRVTKTEVTMARRIEDLREALSPVEKQFGKEKVAIVEEIIRKQAEIGIKRKLLEKTSSENKRREIEEIIGNLGREMEVLRKQAGQYCMMLVRTVYLEQDIKVWDAISSRIAESSTGQKGGGLYDRVNQRMKPPLSQEDKP
jgi:RsiW-degrading membrane proteinase PrsW (M82 family)